MSDLLRASVHRLLLVATLETFRTLGDLQQHHDTAVALLHAYRRAVAFADDHASLPVTTVDMAQAAGISLGRLQAAFRAHSPSELTPEEHLRRARIAAAHRDLIAADPTRGDTVRAIALRWGFPNPSRFALHYREGYGRNPKWTLDR